MKDLALSRRSLLMAVAGAAVLGKIEIAADVEAPSGASGGAADRTDRPAGRSILGPLRVGARVAGCRVETIGDVTLGALPLRLLGADGVAFGLEVCARDAALTAPGETQHHQVFVSNEGTGHVPTAEAQGLAALTVAAIIREHEHGGPAAGLLTLTERVDRHAESIIRPA